MDKNLFVQCNHGHTEDSRGQTGKGKVINSIIKHMTLDGLIFERDVLVNAVSATNEMPHGIHHSSDNVATIVPIPHTESVKESLLVINRK